MSEKSKKCFVIGPIGEADSTVRSDADDFMKYIVTPIVTLPEFGYDPPIRADSLNEPGRITSQIVALLMEADLVIADLTTNNANVYYELSLRHAIGKPVIHMAASGTNLSFDVRDNRTIFYTMHSRVAEGARVELESQIRHVQQAGYKPMNPILETVGIVNLERSAVPEEKALGQLMAMMSQLAADVQQVQSSVRTAEIRALNLAANSGHSNLNSLAAHNLNRLSLAALGGPLESSAVAVASASAAEAFRRVQGAAVLQPKKPGKT